MTIGVGDAVSRGELFAITGSNAYRNIYVDDYDDVIESAFEDYIVTVIKGTVYM